MKHYKVTNINKNGEIIDDLSKYQIPDELQERIWKLMVEGQKKKEKAA